MKCSALERPWQVFFLLCVYVKMSGPVPGLLQIIIVPFQSSDIKIIVPFQSVDIKRIVRFTLIATLVIFKLSHVHQNLNRCEEHFDSGKARPNQFETCYSIVLQFDFCNLAIKTCLVEL